MSSQVLALPVLDVPQPVVGSGDCGAVEMIAMFHVRGQIE